jgi:hypothetical protein
MLTMDIDSLRENVAKRPLQLLRQKQFRLLAGYQAAEEEGGPRLRGAGTSAGVAAQGTTDPAAQEEGSNRATVTVLLEGFATCENAIHRSQVFSR